MIDALINGGFFIAGCAFGALATIAIILERKHKVIKKRHRSRPIDPFKKKTHVIK